MFSGEFISRAINFISFAYLARVLDVNEFGVFGFGIAVLGFLGNFVVFGFDRISLRDLALDQKLVNKYSNTILSLRLLISSSIFLVFLIILIIFNQNNSNILIVLLIGLFFQAVSLSFVFRAVEQFLSISKTQVITSIITVILYLIFVQNQKDTINAACIYSVNSLINAGMLYYLYKKKFGTIKLTIKKKFASYLINESYPLFLSSIMVAVYYSSDMLMLGFMKTDWDVGIYSAANKIFLLGTIPFQLIVSVFLPKIAANKSFSEIKAYFYLICSLGVTIGLTLFFLSPIIITIVYGISYSSAITPLKILALNIFVVSVNMGLGEPITIFGKQKQYLFAVTSGAVINIVLNFLLIPNYSYMGASLATIFSEGVVFLGLLLIYIIKDR